MTKHSVTNWLLEETEPSVRYFTFRDLLGRPVDDSELQAALAAVSSSSVVQKIFSKQNPVGYWEDGSSPYLPKYKSSYWQIMILGQLGLDKSDQRVKKACEYIFKFQLAEGGFTTQTIQASRREYDWLLRKKKKLPPFAEWARAQISEQQLSCLTGNIAAALVRLGYENDRRVKKALQWLVKIQNPDGGWLCPYWRAHTEDTHGCFYGTISPLEALSEVRQDKLTPAMKQAIQGGAEFLLMHRLFQADHHQNRIIHKAWLRFSFPWFYGYNILRGLDVLTTLGYTEDERLQDAIKILLHKRGQDGKWVLEYAPVGRMQVTIEAVGKPSKWVTLIALRILRRLGIG